MPGFHGASVVPAKFQQTNSSGIMKGRFLVFPEGSVEHLATIEDYYPGETTPFKEFSHIKHTCIAGQSFNPKDERWIDIFWSACPNCKCEDYWPHYGGSNLICKGCGTMYARLDAHD